MMLFGLGGYGVQGSDPNLDGKLAALKAKRGNLDDKVTTFLEREIGVDPATLALTATTAREWITGMLEDQHGDRMSFHGNSMGLISASIDTYDGEPITFTDLSPEWHNVTRAYAALMNEQPGYFRFNAERTYPVTVQPVHAPPVQHDDPSQYPPGSVLRIQRQRVDADQLVIDQLYISIGGLLDDITPTILDTMQPITDLTGWHVIEEIIL